MGNNSKSSSMMIVVILGVVICCSCVSVVVPGGLYAFNADFKAWVDGLLGGGTIDTSQCKFDSGVKATFDIKYDPILCDNRCYLKDGKPKRASSSDWRDAELKECKDAWIISSKAGKRVCPNSDQNGKTPGKYVLDPKTGWCGKWGGHANTFSSKLPKNAIAGKTYKKKQLDDQNIDGGGGFFGPAKDGYDDAGNWSKTNASPRTDQDGFTYFAP
jgi:hypothetical protein